LPDVDNLRLTRPWEAQGSRCPQNSKSLLAESNSSKRGLTIRGMFTRSGKAFAFEDPDGELLDRLLGASMELGQHWGPGRQRGGDLVSQMGEGPNARSQASFDQNEGARWSNSQDPRRSRTAAQSIQTGDRPRA
jgi:hypothetical protein